MYKMFHLSTFINETIFYLLKNFHDINYKEIVIRNFQENYHFTDLENQFFLEMENINVIMNMLQFWLLYIPFTNEFVIFTIIYYLMVDNIEYIRKLLIIGNISEVFHYIKGIFYRNIYGYYNVINDIFSYDLKTLELSIIIEGFVKGKDLLKDLNKEYNIINTIFKRNKKNKHLEFDFINEKQKNNYTFKNLCKSVTI